MVVDSLTMSIMTALVVIVSGVTFISETLLRKDEGVGRVWALAFLAGIVTTVSYLVWALEPGAWVAVAMGNAAFVAQPGFMWLGCRRYNARSITVAGASVAAAAVVTFAAVIVAGPGGGDWAGAYFYFAGVGVFALAGAVEACRGRMGAASNARVLAVVLAFQSVFFFGRIVAALGAGFDSSIFSTYFGVVATGLVTVMLTIVALVTMSVLRAGRVQLRGRSGTVMLAIGGDGVLEPDGLSRMLGDLAARAERNGELIGVISVRLDDLAQIATAFGNAESEMIQREWRAASCRFSPTTSFVGEDGQGALVIGIHPASQAEAQRIATRVHRGVVEGLSELGSSVIPVIGVGVALSDGGGYSVDNLIQSARAAAGRAAESSDFSVVVAGPGGGFQPAVSR